MLFQHLGNALRAFHEIAAQNPDRQGWMVSAQTAHDGNESVAPGTKDVGNVQQMHFLFLITAFFFAIGESGAQGKPVVPPAGGGITSVTTPGAFCLFFRETTAVWFETHCVSR